MHQNQWLAAIQQLKDDGVKDTVVPDDLFNKEYREHASTCRHFPRASTRKTAAGPEARPQRRPTGVRVPRPAGTPR